MLMTPFLLILTSADESPGLLNCIGASAVQALRKKISAAAGSIKMDRFIMAIPDASSPGEVINFVFPKIEKSSLPCILLLLLQSCP
jgi:hypothetical protein